MDSKRKITIAVFLAISLLPVCVTPATTTTVITAPATFMSTMQDLESTLLQIGSALGALMIVMECLKWIAAQSPPERESAKKGIIYVLIGLILLKNSEKLIDFLLNTI